MKSYKPPKAQRQLSSDRRYIAERAKNPRPAPTRQLAANTPQCGTIIGGKKVWKRGKRTVQPFDKYAFPIIVGGKRCPEQAAVSTRQDGRSEHRCAAHVGIEWVNTGEVASRPE